MVVPEAAATTAGAAASGNETLAVLVPQGEQGGSQVLQAPSSSTDTGGTEGPGSIQLSLDTIDYDDQGRVIVGGRSAAGSTIQAYLDNQLVGAAVADGANHWLLPLPLAVDTQPHTLRIDQIGTDGSVRPPAEWRQARTLEDAVANPVAGQRLPLVRDAR